MKEYFNFLVLLQLSCLKQQKFILSGSWKLADKCASRVVILLGLQGNILTSCRLWELQKFCHSLVDTPLQFPFLSTSYLLFCLGI